MKTCHQCGQRLFHEQIATPTGEHDHFEVEYRCPEGHTGVIEGQVGMDETEWAKRGAVFGPTARSDTP